MVTARGGTRFDPEPTLPHRSDCSAPASFTAQRKRHFRLANDPALGMETSTDLKHAAVNIRILVPTGVRAASVKPPRLLAELGTTAGTSGLYPEDLTVFNGEVLFSGLDDGVVGLWATNGTAAGTTELSGTSSR
jgi:hypothetical protein